MRRRYAEPEDPRRIPGKDRKVPHTGVVGDKARIFDQDPHAFRKIAVLSDPLSVYGDGSLRGLYKPADALHQHGFSAAVPPHQPTDFSPFTDKAYGIEDLCLSDRQRQIFNLDHIH